MIKRNPLIPRLICDIIFSFTLSSIFLWLFSVYFGFFFSYFLFYRSPFLFVSVLVFVLPSLFNFDFQLEARCNLCSLVVSNGVFLDHEYISVTLNFFLTLSRLEKSLLTWWTARMISFVLSFFNFMDKTILLVYQFAEVSGITFLGPSKQLNLVDQIYLIVSRRGRQALNDWQNATQ